MMLKIIRGRAGLVLAGLVAALCPMLMAPTGGFPSRPTFQAVSIPTAYSTSTCAAAANGSIFVGCDQSPLTNSTAPGKYAIKSFVDATGVPGGANIGLFLFNRSAATNAQEWLEFGNDVDVTVMGMTSSTFSGTVLTGGVSGKQVFLNPPPAYGFCIGRNTSADFCIDGSGNITAPTTGAVPWPLSSVLSSAFNMTSNTTLANSGISVTLPVSMVHYSCNFLMHEVTSGTGGIKLAFGGTATTTQLGGTRVGNTAGTPQGGLFVLMSTATPMGFATVSTTTQSDTVTVVGAMQVTAAGTVTVQAAQNSSSANTTSLDPGSGCLFGHT
jgi:hypothetical protein